MKAFLWALVGLFFGMWVTERERRLEQAQQDEQVKATLQNSLQSIAQTLAAASKTAAAEPRKDRMLEEMSDEYKNQKESLIDYNEDDIAGHIDKICMQLSQPNMTPLEAERVGIALSDLARSALGWEGWRKDRMKRRAQKWIDEIGMEVNEDE
jgi:hypothetical protein